MTKKKDRLSLFLIDIFFINLSWCVYYYVRVETGWIIYANSPSFLLPMIVIYLYWIFIFGVLGLYQHWFARSRFDEFASVVKAVSIGCLILFFAIFIDDYLKEATVISRLLIFIYWFLMVFFVSYGRILLRGIQKRLLENGKGLNNTLIVGTGERAFQLKEMINEYPQLGYKIIGFLGLDKENDIEGQIGVMNDIKPLVEAKEITEVLIALESDQKSRVVDIIDKCSSFDVTIKIMPDMYEIVGGMVRTQQIYGIPLIEVMPELMPHSSKFIKKVIDVVISVISIIVLSPVLLFTALLIKITSPGPVFNIQDCAGKKGKTFRRIKFRTQGLIGGKYLPAPPDDDSVPLTSFGKILRKTKFEWIPQFINVLRNEMSIVGPRPEIIFLTEIYKNAIPYYSKKLSVKPGITGWAQIKRPNGKSIDEIKTALQYDFFYIENMSLTLDSKILISTFWKIFTLKGK